MTFPLRFSATRCVTLVVTLLLTTARSTDAQVGLQISLIEPTGEYGYVFKPAPSIDLVVDMSDDDMERFRVKATVGYYRLKPNQDTMHNYAISGSGSQADVLPGFDVWSNYNAFAVGGRFDFHVLKTKWTPVVGCGVSVYFLMYDYTHRVFGLVDYRENALVTAVALVPHLGVNGKLNKHVAVNGGVSRSMGMQTDYQTQAYWKTSLGALYYF